MAIAEAANLSLLYRFSDTAYNGAIGQPTNADGTSPSAPVLFVTNTLFGTTFIGGANGQGTVFRVNTDGTAFTNLHSFALVDQNSLTNTDGARPYSSLVLLSNTLYGTTWTAGTHDLGALFKVNTDGTGFTNFYNFSGGTLSASQPQGGMVLQSNVLYGTASGSGLGNGVIFAIKIDGTGYTNVHSFAIGSLTNKDGASPYCDLLLANNVLYGTAYGGGIGNAGTIYRLNTDGTGFTNLHAFYANPPVGYSLGNTNVEGAHPQGGVILSGNTLYGTTADGGTNGAGTIYKINTDGTGFTNLYIFTTVDRIFHTNTDGGVPYGNLALSGSKLYGTTSQGGIPFGGGGTLFSINTNGTGFTVLAYLSATNNALRSPLAGLTQSGNTFYGTSASAVFALTALPASIPLNLQLSGGKFILSWTDTAFTLQTAPTLNGSFTNVPNAVSPYTNAMTDSQMFFRLQATQ